MSYTREVCTKVRARHLRDLSLVALGGFGFYEGLLYARRSVEWKLRGDILVAVLDAKDFLCRRCGQREPAGFPLPLREKRLAAFRLNGEAFAEEHASCPETEESPSKKAGRSPADWLKSGDTGVSSQTICAAMSGVNGSLATKTNNWPRDPDDFGRCYRLLKLFPDWRSRLAGLALLYPRTPWVPMVLHWARMTALYEEELPSGAAPKLYALMKQLCAEGGD